MSTTNMSWKDRLRDINVYLRRRRTSEGMYLKAAASILGIDPQVIVEIGVYKGRTSRHLRQLFPKADLWLVDPWKPREGHEGQMYNEYSTKPEWERLHDSVQAQFADDPKTHILRMTSRQAATKVPSSIDLLYIDGCHNYPVVCDDITRWRPLMALPGLFCGHDYYHKGNGIFVKRAVDELVPEFVVVRKKIWLQYTHY